MKLREGREKNSANYAKNMCNIDEYQKNTIKPINCIPYLFTLTAENYQGCYRDDTESRDLPFYVWGKDAGRSAGECMDECVKRGYTYAGLQDGGVCYCGNTFGSYGSANESDCSSKCYGYTRQNCGGSLHNAVYKTKTGKDVFNFFVQKSDVVHTVYTCRDL